MNWMVFLLLYMVSHVLHSGCAFLSCSGKRTYCIKNSDNCYLTCKTYANVTLVKDKDGCSSQNVIYTNTTGNLLLINASISEETVYSCCQNGSWKCSSSFTVSHEVEEVSCLWDLKNDTLLTCSVTGLPDDHISEQFHVSMIINHMGFRITSFEKDCVDISQSVFSCPLEDGYHDSRMDIHIKMEARYDVTISSEKSFSFIPTAKYEELIVEVENVTSEYCILKLALPKDRHMFLLSNICEFPCNITIELNYTDAVTSQNMIESHNRLTKESHVPSITLKKLRPNTNHIVDIKWRRVEDDIWNHIATVNFTTKIGVPKTSPLVLNKAKGNNYIGIYIQKRSEDGYYGPISLVLNKTTNGKEGQRSRRSLSESQHLNFSQTIFVKYNEKESENITLQYATSAGISNMNSKVFISPLKEIENVKRLDVKTYNRTHDALTVDNIDGVEKLHYYWCFGEFLDEKQLVDCKSIGHVEFDDVKKTSVIKRPISDVNCTNCELYYGVAIQQLNKSSSILWKSASNPIIDNIKTTADKINSVYYAFAGIGGVIVCFALVCLIKRCYKDAKVDITITDRATENSDYVYSGYDLPRFTHLSESESSESETNLTETPSTSDNSNESDKPKIVIDTNKDNSDSYPPIIVHY